MAFTSEEEEFEFRMRLEQEQAASQAPQAPQAPQELSTSENAYGGVNAALQGLTMGGADELGSLVGASAAKIGGLFGGVGGDESFGDIYDKMMASEKAKREAFSTANPKTALGLELAGGLATGVTGGAKLIPALAKTKMLANTGRLATPLASVVAGSGEGALAGALSADQGNRLQGGTIGGTIGAAIPAALTGGGSLLRGATNRRVAQELGEGADFMPLSIADDGALSDFYADVVGEAFGGGAVKKQAKPILEKAVAKAAQQETGLAGLKIANKEAVKQSARAIRGEAEARADLVAKNFRDKAALSSVPDGMPQANVDAIMDANPQKANELMGDYWYKNGFQSVKQNTFNISPKGFKQSFKKLLDDPSTRDIAGPELDSILARLNETGTNLGKNGVNISGDEFLQIRNTYAKAANKETDGVKRSLFRDIADVFDKKIGSELKGAAADQYKEELGKWKKYVGFQKAVGKASNKRGGAFTPDDWISSQPNYQLGKGFGALQDEAMDAQTQYSAIRKSIGNAVQDDPVKALARDAETAAKEGLKTTKKALAEMQKRGDKPSNLFRKVAATSILSGPSFVAGAGLGTLPAGALTAKLLSSQGAQRTLAGQTAAQKATAEALRNMEPFLNKGLAPLSSALGANLTLSKNE